MPDLTVIAGCNGSGKSTYASTFLPEGVTSFDYDKLYLETYHSLPDSEFRGKFAKDQTTTLFEDSIKNAIEKGLHFCYETNFDSYPLFWPQTFRDSGYQINIIFFCLTKKKLLNIEFKFGQNLKVISLIIKQLTINGKLDTRT